MAVWTTGRSGRRTVATIYARAQRDGTTKPRMARAVHERRGLARDRNAPGKTNTRTGKSYEQSDRRGPNVA